MPSLHACVAGFLCLCLAFLSGCSKRVIIPATTPHVYSSEDAGMQGYESEEEEIERLVREIKILRAEGSEKADVRKLKAKIRELESAIASYASVGEEGTPDGSLTLDQEFKAFLRENHLPWPYLWPFISSNANGLDTEEDAPEAEPGPGRVRFGDGPMEVVE